MLLLSTLTMMPNYPFLKILNFYIFSNISAMAYRIKVPLILGYLGDHSTSLRPHYNLIQFLNLFHKISIGNQNFLQYLSNGLSYQSAINFSILRGSFHFSETTLQGVLNQKIFFQFFLYVSSTDNL